MSTNSHTPFARVVFLNLFLALASPALSICFFGLCGGGPIGMGGDCSRNRNGCASGFTCLHGPSSPVPFQCHRLKGEGMACGGEEFWVCQGHLRCVGADPSIDKYGTCVPPHLPIPKYGFCGYVGPSDLDIRRFCPPGSNCVQTGLIGRCVDARPPSPTPRPSPSRTPRPSPSRSPIPSPSRSPKPVQATPTPHPPILSEPRKQRLREKIKAAGGCNANVCFAIDGSSSISADEFEIEKRFVLDVVSVLTDNPIEIAAVQFSTSTYPIQALTVDDEKFILEVETTNQVPGASFVTGGINYCFGELVERLGESNKIVLLSDGRSTIGGGAVRRADGFRELGGDVCVVGAGDQNEQELLDIAGGDDDRYYQADSLSDFNTLANHIESVTLSICSVPK
eukprot:TRINITY_DN2699_c0_g2_i1.p1 TRINITY_DN2699_c0_g2~~TRINITY_DN2699_c0_g2_i1.p1  ORF type:complete len:395 (+),score=24.76 TRINITY_DN2699_c0_g2_i1:2051-3235(+)